ncbi:MAG: phosphoribosylformylglycinamidine cyclo-ligase [Acidimicrobiia bacterium]
MAGETYRGAGVDIDAGEAAVDRIKPLVRSTYRPEVIGDIGSFGGLFALGPLLAGKYRDPVLVSSTDGVGTKAQVAAALGRYDTIGLDLVAMCVDDIACQGAEPLFFLDYISIGKLDPAQVEALVAGVAEGCRQAGCALIGGEMAEHPGVMAAGEFDLVGFAVGVVERDRIISGRDVTVGDVLVALPSPGLRSNGYSLARRVLLQRANLKLEGALADEMLLPSVIYSPVLHRIIAAADVHGIAHITGGGLPGNVNRILPKTCDAVIRRDTWEVPAIFERIRDLGEVDLDEMERVFNMGLGMVIAMPEAEVAAARRAAPELLAVGEVVAGTGQVRVV